MTASTTSCSSDSSYYNLFFAQGKENLLSGNFGEGVLNFQLSLQYATCSLQKLEAHNLIGQCLFAVGERTLSHWHFKTAIEMNVQSERGRLVTGFCLNWLKQHEAGLQIAQEVLQKNPMNIDAYILQLKIYQSLGNEEKAKEMKQAIAMREKENLEFESKVDSILPNNVSKNLNFEDFLVSSKDPEKVKKVLFSKGILDFRMGNIEEALEKFLGVLEIAPTDIKTMYNVSCFYFKLEKNVQAIAMLEKLLEIQPNHENAQKLLALIKKEPMSFS